MSFHGKKNSSSVDVIVPKSACSPLVRISSWFVKNSLGSPSRKPGLLRFLSLVAVPHQLLERLEHRVRREVVGVLAFDHDQRQAVHEQHDVRDDEPLARTRRVDAELVDGVELVSLRMLEVDQLDVRILLAGQFVGIDLCPEEQLRTASFASTRLLAG